MVCDVIVLFFFFFLAVLEHSCFVVLPCACAVFVLGASVNIKRVSLRVLVQHILHCVSLLMTIFFYSL